MERIGALFGRGNNAGYGAGYNTGYNTNVNGGGSALGEVGKYVLGGLVLGAIVFTIVYFVLGRADTRPVREGFQGPVFGTTNLPCGRASSEAQATLAFFEAKGLGVNNADFKDLRDLLSRFTCLKQDLMAPQQMITSVKELGFETHMDIQPLADLTARCFSKTIPERDLSIQFIKWRDYGVDLIRRLCTAGNLGEAEVLYVEKLFLAAWTDVYDVANTVCITSIKDGGAFKGSPRDPAPSADEGDADLRPYDGYY